MGLSITDSQTKLSQANTDLQTAGRSSEITADGDGTQSVWSYSAAQAKLVQGLPTDGSTPSQVYLASDMVAPSSSSSYFANAKAYAKSSATSCVVMDTRATPVANAPYYYYYSKAASASSKDSMTEGRYLSEGGKLVAAMSSTQNYGWYFTRTESGTSPKPVLSSRYPNSLSVYADGSKKIMTIALPTKTDGYNWLNLTQNGDGSGSVTYVSWNGTMSVYGSPSGLGNPGRTQGPSAVSWNAAGEITSLDSGSGQYFGARGTPYTVAEYNAATGQNWDGKYFTGADFDLSLPYQPSAMVAK